MRGEVEKKTLEKKCILTYFYDVTIYTIRISFWIPYFSPKSCESNFVCILYKKASHDVLAIKDRIFVLREKIGFRTLHFFIECWL